MILESYGWSYSYDCGVSRKVIMKKEFGVVGSCELSRVEPVQELGSGRVRSRAELSRVELS